MDGRVLASWVLRATDGPSSHLPATARLARPSSASLLGQLHGVKKETNCEASDSSASRLLRTLPIPQQPLMCAQAIHLHVRGPRFY